MIRRNISAAFSIVELVIVVAVVAILATITVVGYNSVTQNAREKTLLSDLSAVVSEVTRYGTNNGGKYNSAIEWFSGSGSQNQNINFTPSSGNVIDVVAQGAIFCVRVYNPDVKDHATISTAVSEGSNEEACSLLRASSAAGGAAGKLVGWWKLNGDALDSSGNGNHGDIRGPVPTTSENGASNGAYNFDGTDYIHAQIGSLSGDVAHSISLWLKPTSLSVSRVDPITIGDAVTNGYSSVELTSSATYWYHFNNHTTAAPLGIGNWSLVTLSYTGGGATIANKKLYVNGVLMSVTQGGTNYGQVLSLPSNPVVGIGYDRGRTDAYFNGAIDDVRVYDYALTQSEVTALYSAGAQ